MTTALILYALGVFNDYRRHVINPQWLVPAPRLDIILAFAWPLVVILEIALLAFDD